jgi:hypothetical protein
MRAAQIGEESTFELQETWPVATNGFFEPVRDVPLENVEPSSEGDSNEICEEGENLSTGRPFPSF